MDAEISTLITSGAATIVKLMATDTWNQAKGQIAKFFAKARHAGPTSADLDRSHRDLSSALEAGDSQAASDVEAAWRTELRRLLQADPSLETELRALLRELSPDAAHPAMEVHNTISGGTQHGTIVQGGTFNGLTLYGSPPPAKESD